MAVQVTRSRRSDPAPEAAPARPPAQLQRMSPQVVGERGPAGALGPACHRRQRSSRGAGRVAHGERRQFGRRHQPRPQHTAGVGHRPAQRGGDAKPAFVDVAPMQQRHRRRQSGENSHVGAAPGRRRHPAGVQQHGVRSRRTRGVVKAGEILDRQQVRGRRPQRAHRLDRNAEIRPYQRQRGIVELDRTSAGQQHRLRLTAQAQRGPDVLVLQPAGGQFTGDQHLEPARELFQTLAVAEQANALAAQDRLAGGIVEARRCRIGRSRQIVGAVEPAAAHRAAAPPHGEHVLDDREARRPRRQGRPRCVDARVDQVDAQVARQGGQVGHRQAPQLRAVAAAPLALRDHGAVTFGQRDLGMKRLELFQGTQRQVFGRVARAGHRHGHEVCFTAEPGLLPASQQALEHAPRGAHVDACSRAIRAVSSASSCGCRSNWSLSSSSRAAALTSMRSTCSRSPSRNSSM